MRKIEAGNIHPCPDKLLQNIPTLAGRPDGTYNLGSPHFLSPPPPLLPDFSSLLPLPLFGFNL
jgi:hypothetical protein